MVKWLFSLFAVFPCLTALLLISPTIASLFRISAVNIQDVSTLSSLIPLSLTNQNTDKISNSTITDESIDTPKLYLNSTYGVEINYPNGWAVNDGDKATIFHNQSKSLNVVAEIMAPIQSSYYDSKIGASHNSLRIIVENYSTFGDYTNDNIQKYIGNKDSEEENKNKLLTVANKRIGSIGLYCHNFDLKSWNQKRV